jgi:hypothetical protein
LRLSVAGALRSLTVAARCEDTKLGRGEDVDLG